MKSTFPQMPKPELEAVPEEVLLQVVDILADPSLIEDAEDEAIDRLVKETDTRDRLVVVVPEAFGMVLAAHVDRTMVFPKTFMAQNAAGNWIEFPMGAEPFFAAGGRIAAHVMHNGPRATMVNIANRSAVLNVLNQMLNAKAETRGAVMAPITFNAIRAELYATEKPAAIRPSFWKRLFGQ